MIHSVADSPLIPAASSAAPRVIVVGAVNMDLSGTPFSALRPGDSNPGHTRLSPGGVGRNIAENLSRLGLNVSMLTVLGEDLFGIFIQNHCRQVRIDLSLSLTLPEEATSTYLCVNEPNGDLNIAVSDMSICDRLTPDRLEGSLPALNQADLVVLDANLPEETLRWLSASVRVPLAADPVSVSKACRVKGILPSLVLMKPNVPEAEALTGLSVRGESDLHRVTDALLDSGLKQVFLSLGSRGVLACSRDRHVMLPCFPGPVRNTTGCGDAFLAAVCDAWLRHMDLAEAASRGLAAAALCAADPGAVCAALSPEKLNGFLSSRMADHGKEFCS